MAPLQSKNTLKNIKIRMDTTYTKTLFTSTHNEDT